MAAKDIYPAGYQEGYILWTLGSLRRLLCRMLAPESVKTCMLRKDKRALEGERGINIILFTASGNLGTRTKPSIMPYTVYLRVRFHPRDPIVCNTPCSTGCARPLLQLHDRTSDGFFYPWCWRPLAYIAGDQSILALPQPNSLLQLECDFANQDEGSWVCDLGLHFSSTLLWNSCTHMSWFSYRTCKPLGFTLATFPLNQIAILSSLSF